MNSREFDNWAKTYENGILNKNHNGYPFEGYFNLLKTIQGVIIKKKFSSILDIGLGTGLLSEYLYHKGIDIYGIDFSNKMIKRAKNKMPNAKLFEHDFSNLTLPTEIKKNYFDCIISSYAFHHINNQRKIIYIKKLASRLKKKGLLLIGDISFSDNKEMEKMKKKYANIWDSEEFYFIADEICTHLKLEKKLNIEYFKISNCAGIFKVSNI